MKIIIISDIRSKSESIIPFGLKLARQLKSMVDIIHTIDSRTEHAVPSSYSDSQTFALDGKKLSYKETMEREKRTAKLLLDKLISHDASNLHYPLKVNIIIEENSIEQKIRDYLNKGCSYLFLLSSKPDGHIFTTMGEIFDAVNETGAKSLIIPPGQEYNAFKNFLIPADFSSSDFKKYKQILFLLRSFKPLINAVGVLKTRNNAEAEAIEAKWKNEALKYFKVDTLETILLEGNDYPDSLVNYINRNKPDLILLFYKKENILKSLFSESTSLKIIKRIETPVLLYQVN